MQTVCKLCAEHVQTWSFRQKYFLLHFLQRSFCLLYNILPLPSLPKRLKFKRCSRSSNSTFQTNGQTYNSTTRATFSQLKNLFLLGNRNQENHRHFDGDLQFEGHFNVKPITYLPFWHTLVQGAPKKFLTLSVSSRISQQIKTTFCQCGNILDFVPHSQTNISLWIFE